MSLLLARLSRNPVFEMLRKHFDEEELSEEATCKEILQVGKEGDWVSDFDVVSKQSINFQE